MADDNNDIPQPNPTMDGPTGPAAPDYNDGSELPLVDPFSAVEKGTELPAILPPGTGGEFKKPDNNQPPDPSQPPVDPITAAIERSKGKTARDYSGLDEEEIGIFKKMSNDSYNKLYPVYKAFKAAGGKFDDSRIKELEKQLEDTRNFRYFEHPEAFQSDETYQQTVQLESIIESAYNHWLRQLEAAESGGKVRPLVKSPQGGLVPGDEIEVTPAIKAQIHGLIAKTRQDLAEAQRERATLAESFKGRYKTFEDNLKQVHNELFGKHEEILAPLAKEELKRFPAYLHHQPSIRMLAYGLAAMKLGASEKEQQQITAAGNKAAAQLQSKSGPSNSQLGSGTKSSNPFVPSDAEMKRLKEEFSY